MAGVPVINTQNSPEYRNLIDTYNCGVNCESGNAQSVADAIEKLYKDEQLKKTMGENSLRLGKEKFDRNKTYYELNKVIEVLCECNDNL